MASGEMIYRRDMTLGGLHEQATKLKARGSEAKHNLFTSKLFSGSESFHLSDEDR